MEAIVERNSVFAPCWDTKCRYVVMKGSAGSGKSYDSATFYVVRLLTERGRNLLCVRKSEITHRTSTYNELCKAIERLGLSAFFKCSVSPLKISCTLGGEILFCGVNDPAAREKLKSVTAASGNITDVWIEEATELTREDFEIIDDRLRGKLPEGLFYQIRLTFNPVSANHWIKRDFFDKASSNVLAHHSTYLDNAFCDKAYHERMERRRITDPEGYRIYGLGCWGETGGLVLSNYEVKNFDTDPSNFDSVRYGQDFGFNHANALLCVGIKDGDIYVLKELYVREKTTDEIIALAADWDKSVPMICDSAEPDRILTWRRAGFAAQAVKKYPGSVKGGIDWLKARRIVIHPSCTGLIDELSTWKWLKNPDGTYSDEPTPVGDDAAAALRYAVSVWQGVGPHRTVPKEAFRPFFFRNARGKKRKII